MEIFKKKEINVLENDDVDVFTLQNETAYTVDTKKTSLCIQHNKINFLLTSGSHSFSTGINVNYSQYFLPIRTTVATYRLT